MEEKKEDFVVKDKRRFFSEKEENKEIKKETKEAINSKEKINKEEAPEIDNIKKSQLPDVNFSTFIFSLNSSALFHLGLIEEPDSKRQAKDLPLAKQTIDILGILEEKTKGNLTREEDNFLKNILYNLRMLYIKEKN